MLLYNAHNDVNTTYLRQLYARCMCKETYIGKTPKPLFAFVIYQTYIYVPIYDLIKKIIKKLEMT